jgi:hypothetical protein
MNRITLAFRALLVAAAIYFLLYVWPTPYKEYRQGELRVIRVNRVTGHQQLLTLEGWRAPQ